MGLDTVNNIMGTGGTKQLQQSGVHVVVVQPKEDGSISAKVLTNNG